MQVYTYSEARQKLASVLDKAEATGSVIIQRRDGRRFTLVPPEDAGLPPGCSIGRGSDLDKTPPGKSKPPPRFRWTLPPRDSTLRGAFVVYKHGRGAGKDGTPGAVLAPGKRKERVA
jgi:antitoxin (DNA-binding transcriptional repressor) of toxin-antitoxin stability system